METRLRKYINKKFRLYPKTTEILEVREELFSIMMDKYNDCILEGMSEEQSYSESIDMLVDYRAAIHEVETGSSLSALKRTLISIAAFTTFYFIALTGVYLFASMVVLDSFEHTWLIAVGGSFLYLVYFSLKAYQYARLFHLKLLERCFIGLIYFSMIPLLYVFPSLYVSVMGYPYVWSTSWMIVLGILFCYVLADYILYRQQYSGLQGGLHLIVAGLILTTIIYLSASVFLHVWGTAWILYVGYLALVALVFYVNEKQEKRD